MSPVSHHLQCGITLYSKCKEGNTNSELAQGTQDGRCIIIIIVIIIIIIIIKLKLVFHYFFFLLYSLSVRKTFCDN